MTHVEPDKHNPALFRVVDGGVPLCASDWMRAFMYALAYIATQSPLDVPTLYVAEPGQANITATLVPITPLVGGSLPELDDMSTASGWAVVHPAGSIDVPELDEPNGFPIATGSLLLPGVPEIGLSHRAAWGAVDTAGRVANMQYTSRASGNETVDLAVLTALLTH